MSCWLDLIRRKHNLDFYIEPGTVQCVVQHRKPTQICQLQFLNYGKWVTIHDLDQNWLCRNWSFYCKNKPKQHLQLLTHIGSKLRNCSRKNYIRVNGQKIHKIRNTFITNKLLIFCNTQALGKREFAPSQWHKQLINNFEVTLIAALHKKENKKITDTYKIREFVKLHVLSLHILEDILKYLWVNCWLPCCSMCLFVFYLRFICLSFAVVSRFS